SNARAPSQETRTHTWQVGLSHRNWSGKTRQNVERTSLRFSKVPAPTNASDHHPRPGSGMPTNRLAPISPRSPPRRYTIGPGTYDSPQACQVPKTAQDSRMDAVTPQQRSGRLVIELGLGRVCAWAPYDC